MDEKLNESLDKVLQWAEQGEAFIADQAPLVAQEILAWKFWSGVAGGTISMVACIGAIILARYLLTRATEEESGVPTPKAFLSFIASLPTVLLLVISAVTSFQCFMDAIKVLLAPRIVIIEHIQRFFT